MILISLNVTYASTSIDSIQLKLSKANSEIEKCQLLNEVGAHYESVSDYSLALKNLTQAKKIGIQNNFIPELIACYNYIGYVYWHMSEYDSSFYHHNQALLLAENNEVSASIKSFTYLMLGNDYYDTGEFDKSSEMYFKALKESEKSSDIQYQVKSHNRLSKLFYKLNDFQLSREHAQKAIGLNSKNDYRDFGDSYNTFGNIYLNTGVKDSALLFFNKTYQNFAKSGDVIGQAIACINLGDTYLAYYNEKGKNHHLDSSFNYYNKSYLLNDKVNNKFGVIYGLWGMADVSMKKYDYDLALINYRKAISISKQIGAKSEINNLYQKFHTLFDLKGNVDSSLYYLKKHVVLNEEIENSEKSKFLILQESKYAAEKIISTEKAQIEKQKLIEKEENKWKNVILVFIVLAVVILSYLLLMLARRLKIIRAKNTIINSMNSELEIQKKEIIDSINYAKRIQNAIIPNAKILKEYLKNYFVYYQPKDIVAGDFYWVEKFGENILFAVADCTGHGVPGAMMSVICKNALDNVTKSNHLLKPNQILDEVNEIIQSTLKGTSQSMNDGMDIALCSWNQNTNKVLFSGAYNSLYHIQNNKLIRIKGDRKPIGKFQEKSTPFSLHEVQFKKGETIYLFTDGFADQFGGVNDKKFGYKKFKKLILSVQDKSMKKQNETLSLSLKNWMKECGAEQIDDVCVMGVKK